jgi:hypothetical protein
VPCSVPLISRRKACIADKTIGAFAHTVAFTGLTGDNLAGGSEAEPLFAAAFGFQFRHFRILI